MLDVLMITHNEAANLPHSLPPLIGWARAVFVIDSGSDDGSQALASRLGATVIEHPWEGYSRQRNWGLANLPFEAPWTLILDADEIVTEELKRSIDAAIARAGDRETGKAGYFLNRLTYFLDRPIRHCGYFPSWHLRLIRRDAGRYEQRPVHEHLIVDGPTARLDGPPLIHRDRRGLEHFVAKHNRYSTLEAEALWQEHRSGPPAHEGQIGRAARWRRWLKRTLLPRLPLLPLWRFGYMYLVRGGVLDGRAGLTFCTLIAFYDYLVAIKYRQLRRTANPRGPAIQHDPSSAEA